jgi:transcriptional regulator
MHILRPQFRIEEQRALAFAAERGFGVVVATDVRGPRASHVPFVIARRDGSVGMSRSAMIGSMIPTQTRC